MTLFQLPRRPRASYIFISALALVLATSAKAVAYFCFDDCLNEYGLTVKVAGETYWYTHCDEFDMGGGAVGITCYYARFVWN